MVFIAGCIVIGLILQWVYISLDIEMKDLNIDD